MGSLRAKQASYIEILKAIQLGQLQGLTRFDRLLSSQIWNTLNKMEYDPDLKLYLPFDEASGQSAFDLSGNGNDGAVTGATIVDGVFGKCRSFDGIDDLVDVSQNSGLQIYSPTLPYSVEMWVKGPYDQVDMRVFSEGSSLSNYPLFNIGTARYADTPKLNVFIRDDDNDTVMDHVASTGDVFDDTWHHIIWTDHAGTAKLYIDSVEDATDFTYTPDTLTLNKTAIGAIIRAAPSNWFNGLIDELRIYSRVLSADEGYLHYLAGALKLGLI